MSFEENDGGPVLETITIIGTSSEEDAPAATLTGGIPTLTEWGLIVLILLTVGTGLILLQRRRTA